MFVLVLFCMGGLDISFCQLACLVICTVTEFIKREKEKKNSILEDPSVPLEEDEHAVVDDYKQCVQELLAISVR